MQKEVKITHSTEDYDPPEAEVRIYIPVFDSKCSGSYNMAIENDDGKGGINWILLTVGMVLGCCVCSGLIGGVVYVYKKHPELRMGYVEEDKKKTQVVVIQNEQAPLLRKNQ